MKGDNRFSYTPVVHRTVIHLAKHMLQAPEKPAPVWDQIAQIWCHISREELKEQGCPPRNGAYWYDQYKHRHLSGRPKDWQTICAPQDEQSIKHVQMRIKQKAQIVEAARTLNIYMPPADAATMELFRMPAPSPAQQIRQPQQAHIDSPPEDSRGKSRRQSRTGSKTSPSREPKTHLATKPTNISHATSKRPRQVSTDAAVLARVSKSAKDRRKLRSIDYVEIYSESSDSEGETGLSSKDVSTGKMALAEVDEETTLSDYESEGPLARHHHVKVPTAATLARTPGYPVIPSGNSGWKKAAPTGGPQRSKKSSKQWLPASGQTDVILHKRVHITDHANTAATSQQVNGPPQPISTNRPSSRTAVKLPHPHPLRISTSGKETEEDRAEGSRQAEAAEDELSEEDNSLDETILDDPIADGEAGDTFIQLPTGNGGASPGPYVGDWQTIRAPRRDTSRFHSNDPSMPVYEYWKKPDQASEEMRRGRKRAGDEIADITIGGVKRQRKSIHVTAEGMGNNMFAEEYNGPSDNELARFQGARQDSAAGKPASPPRKKQKTVWKLSKYNEDLQAGRLPQPGAGATKTLASDHQARAQLNADPPSLPMVHGRQPETLWIGGVPHATSYKPKEGEPMPNALKPDSVLSKCGGKVMRGVIDGVAQDVVVCPRHQCSYCDGVKDDSTESTSNARPVYLMHRCCIVYDGGDVAGRFVQKVNLGYDWETDDPHMVEEATVRLGDGIARQVWLCDEEECWTCDPTSELVYPTHW